MKEKVDLKKGFGQYIFEASAESYSDISCNSVMITWISSTKGKIQSCQAEGKRNVKIMQCQCFYISFPLHSQSEVFTSNGTAYMTSNEMSQ